MKKRILILVVIALLACPGLAGISVLSNQGLPERSPVVDRLSETDQAVLFESVHLLSAVGDQVWPGWKEEENPIVLFNEAYAFLLGYPDPPAGWVKPPQDELRGGPWQPVPGGTFLDETYYRQEVEDAGMAIGAFTVVVGGKRWAASLTAYDWSRIELRKLFQEEWPGPVAAVLPYRLVVPLFWNADVMVVKVLHESFHAYQGEHAPEKLLAAETDNRKYQDIYAWDDDQMQADWEAELNALADGLEAESDAEARAAVRRFVEQRRERRSLAVMQPGWADFERGREWLEGLAMFAELSAYRMASHESYQPADAILGQEDFHQYKRFESAWSDELSRLRRAMGGHDQRFYSAGMAQAFLLDRLMPGWKEQAFRDDVWLEDLLAQAVEMP